MTFQFEMTTSWTDRLGTRCQTVAVLPAQACACDDVYERVAVLAATMPRHVRVLLAIHRRRHPLHRFAIPVERYLAGLLPHPPEHLRRSIENLLPTHHHFRPWPLLSVRVSYEQVRRRPMDHRQDKSHAAGHREVCHPTATDADRRWATSYQLRHRRLPTAGNRLAPDGETVLAAHRHILSLGSIHHRMSDRTVPEDTDNRAGRLARAAEVRW